MKGATGGMGRRAMMGRTLGALALSAWSACAARQARAQQPASDASASGNRVVSIGGSITEIVYALGAQDRLVAVDSTSRYPSEAGGLPNIGYMRQLSAEPILALDPTLVLVVEDAGPPAVLDLLRAAGLRLVVIPDEPSPQGVLKKVTIVARALGMEAEGKTMAARLGKEFALLHDRLSDVDRKPSVLFLLSIGSGAPLAAGRNTSAAGIIELAGGRNAVDAFEGFKPLSPEATVPTAPEVLLVTERTLGLLGGREGLFARPELAVTPAGRHRRLVAMDGLLLLGFGPRTPVAVRKLAGALHPGLSLPSIAG